VRLSQLLRGKAPFLISVSVFRNLFRFLFIKSGRATETSYLARYLAIAFVNPAFAVRSSPAHSLHTHSAQGCPTRFCSSLKPVPHNLLSSPYE